MIMNVLYEQSSSINQFDTLDDMFKTEREYSNILFMNTYKSKNK